ncbi:uncharacterized protein LACBIDRAFT_322879 [Laccaria bicolor S238N-H82]|uniref:Predicted protein n=1 Tax=Laccaria bicolor (strain S238N-H82 / ATCC MYA-4686) TaxID=486041 RepID=B0CVF4_LACBS|nr:uncharacterized protein LACBIDRAFT_322879 [Laccaria bicolor S238N-H82]EDR13737.1 predicted protein [Laccaria bicolor S238N-H82]|eukprot:XP_001876235.1 predicted protein [Laccaria bicolor S238N-H82]
MTPTQHHGHDTETTPQRHVTSLSKRARQHVATSLSATCLLTPGTRRGTTTSTHDHDHHAHRRRHASPRQRRATPTNDTPTTTPPPRQRATTASTDAHVNGRRRRQQTTSTLVDDERPPPRQRTTATSTDDDDEANGRRQRQRMTTPTADDDNAANRRQRQRTTSTMPMDGHVNDDERVPLHHVHTATISHPFSIWLGSLMPPLRDTRVLRRVTAPQFLGHRINYMWYHFAAPRYELFHVYHEYSPPPSRTHTFVEKSRSALRFHNGGGTADFIKMKLSVSQANLNSNKGEKTIDHISHDTPTPSLARIPAALKGDNSTSTIPSPARIPAAFEGNNSATTDNDSTPSITVMTLKKQSLPIDTSYAHCSCMKSCCCQDFENRYFPSQTSSRVISPEEFPSDHHPNHQSPPFKPGIYNDCHKIKFYKPNRSTSHEIIVSIRTRKKGNNPILSIARGPAASKGDYATRLIDDPPCAITPYEDESLIDLVSQSIPQGLVARSPAVFEGNRPDMKDDRSVPPIPVIVLENQNPPSRTSQTTVLPEKFPFCQHPIVYTSPQLCEDEPTIDPASQSTPETLLVRNFAAFEGGYVTWLIDDVSTSTILYKDEPTVDPAHQSTSETPLARNLAAFEGGYITQLINDPASLTILFEVEPIIPLPSIA